MNESFPHFYIELLITDDTSDDRYQMKELSKLSKSLVSTFAHIH